LPRIPDHLALLKIDITFDDNLNQSDDYLFGNLSNYGQNNIYGAGLEQKSHQGLASCKLIKSYVEDYKCLKEVSIILKLLLAKLGLNSPYHGKYILSKTFFLIFSILILGGISSYSTVLLLVAFMNKWNLKMNPTLTPARLLMSFLDYYSYYFKVSLFGIDVSNDGSFFEHSAPETNFVILDPLNNQDNTTRNSFMTHEIIKDFRTAFNSLKSKKL
jgi:DNA polymerase sigma